MLTVVTSKGKLWEDVRVLTQAQKIFHSELRNQEPMTKMHNSPLPDLRLYVLLKSPWPFFPLPPPPAKLVTVCNGPVETKTTYKQEKYESSKTQSSFVMINKPKNRRTKILSKALAITVREKH